MGSQRVRRDLVTERACQGEEMRGGAGRGWKEREGEKERCEDTMRGVTSTQVSSLAFPPVL